MNAVAPDRVGQWTAPVLMNERVARDTYRLRLDAPELAAAVIPGQFVMIRAGATTDPLLGRPLALYEVILDRSDTPIAMDVVYTVVGRGTAALAEKRPGDRLPLWGPLGNGFGEAPPGPVIFVAGGIGQTPFLSLGRWWLGHQAYAGRFPGNTRSTSAILLYGVRSADLIAGVTDFHASGIRVQIATDDGSAGHHGYVTELLARQLESNDRPARVIACGPPQMLHEVTRLVERWQVPCEVSLENHMACGFGVCFSCVAPIRQSDGSIDLRRVCVEGPIISAFDVDWHASNHRRTNP